MSFQDSEDVKEEIRARLPMQVLCERVNLAMKRSGPKTWVACCPFHAEKSGSFTIGGRREDAAHCFGCGWSGDIFAFWMEIQSVDFKTALEQLAGLAGVRFEGVEFPAPRVRKLRQPEGVRASVEDRPVLPPLRHLRREECEMLAESRGLNPEAVWVAARGFRRAAFSLWPLFLRGNGVWMPRCERHGTHCLLDQASCVAAEVWPSWVALDGTRNVAEFRRLDNGRYPRHDGSEIKSWSTRGKSWPVGAAELDGRAAVALVEGGPDMLAAYDFLWSHGLLDRVGVVCMLGAGNRIREEALALFQGKRVRIFVDADALKDVDAHGVMIPAGKRKVPGMEAAARWQGQLTLAGAAVETFTVGPVYEPGALAAWGRAEMGAAEVPVTVPGLLLPDGSGVKDVNDLARCGPEVRDCAEVREAWRDWDF